MYTHTDTHRQIKALLKRACSSLSVRWGAPLLFSDTGATSFRLLGWQQATPHLDMDNITIGLYADKLTPKTFYT
jgi:hypothetical protein